MVVPNHWVHVDNLDEDTRGYTLAPNRELFTGTSYFTNLATGLLEEETEYAEGLKHGIERCWHLNGVLKSECQYWQGMPHGEMRTWYVTGFRASWGRWELGCLVESIDWDPNGGQAHHPRIAEIFLDSLELRRKAYGIIPIPPPLEDHGHWPKPPPPMFSHVQKWDLTTDEAMNVQIELAQRVIHTDDFSSPIKYVAGVDVAYAMDDDPRVFAGIVVIDVDSMETVESRTAVGSSAFPYVPGLFAFRELPWILRAFEQLDRKPDLIICDGQGIAHPRRCGLASHLGLLLDIPTLGCAKTRFIGEYAEPMSERGSNSPLIERGEVIGCVLRTQAGVNPLFVSIGHRISLSTAREWVLRMALRFRQPEPIRRANELVNTLRAKGQGEGDRVARPEGFAKGRGIHEDMSHLPLDRY